MNKLVSNKKRISSMDGCSTYSGAVLVLARWGPTGGPQFQLGKWGAQYAAELRILLVYLSESLGRLGQNGGRHWGPHF